MRVIKEYNVEPSLPSELECLRYLAYNLRWTWDHDTISVLRRLDRDLWEQVNHNPVLLLGSIEQERLQARTKDDGYLAQLHRVCDNLERYLTCSSWFNETYDGGRDFRIAYFSAEFGITECIPMYSGGLGILAADHLKSSSDLGLPLVGVGLAYQQGYFHQYLNIDGWQQETYPLNDFYNLPILLERNKDGSPLTITVDMDGRIVYVQVWRAQVGRIPLYLLDTNVPQNNREDQDITDQLYGGDLEMRIKQEIVLGIGGIKVLAALGMNPEVCHMNEGHSAFMALERSRQLVEKHGLSFAEAREATIGGNVFTTHTPVPAGIDEFPPNLIERYFGKYCESLKITLKDLLALGRKSPEDNAEPFNMAIFAIRMAGNSNGVSKLHGKVSRAMWQSLWPNVPQDEVPIGSVTNGIHIPSWISADMADLFNRYLGPAWLRTPVAQTIWERIDQIPDEELWRTHERRRERLVAFARRQLHKQLESSGASPSEVEQADEALDPEALTIGFARRFATYKRATLLLQDPHRLLKILTDTDHPVQFIFAGKAHPRDNEGKDIIRQLVHFARREGVQHRLVFLEDYSMATSRYLVEGADVWLNTPLRPMEASGTSGMKAAANGCLNFSILDGWWAEAYTRDIGWAIGKEEEYDDLNYQNEVESSALYDLLEEDIIPLFYKRGKSGVPRGWTAMMKASMRALCPQYNTNRIVREYLELFYLPAADRWERLSHDSMRLAKVLAHWKSEVQKQWGKVKIERIEADIPDNLKVGDEFQIRALVNLDSLGDDDVSVELYQGVLDPAGSITNGEIIPMTCEKPAENGLYWFYGTIRCQMSGRHGIAIRVLPNHEELNTPHEMGLITWG